MNAALIRNERTKLTATFINGIAIAVFAVGGLTQTIKALDTSTAITYGTLALTFGCFLGAFVLHMIARAILGRLEE